MWEVIVKVSEAEQVLMKSKHASFGTNEIRRRRVVEANIRCAILLCAQFLRLLHLHAT